MKKLAELLERGWKIEFWEDDLGWIDTFAEHPIMEEIQSSIADTPQEAMENLYATIREKYPYQWR